MSQPVCQMAGVVAARRDPGRAPQQGNRPRSRVLPSAHARHHGPRARYRHRAGRHLRRRPRGAPPRGVDRQSRPAVWRVSPRRERRASASASSSMARGGSRAPAALTIGEADRVAAARRPDRPRERHGPAQPRRPRRPPAGPRSLRDARSKRTRSRSRSRAKIARSAGRRRGAMRRGQGHRLHGHDVRRPARVEDVRRDATAASPSRSSPTSAPGIEANAVDGDEQQRRSYPDAGGGWQARRLRVRPGAGPRRQRRARRRGGRRAARPRRSARRAAGRSSSTRPSSTCRSTRAAATRPSWTASSARRRAYAGTSFLTTDKLGSGFRYGVRPGRRSSPTRRRPAGWAPSAGTTRAWRPRRCRSCRTASSSATCRSRETAPRIGRQSGGAMRADGWNRIPLIRMTNINLLPEARDEPGRHRRRHRRRPLPGIEPELVASTTGA